MRSLIASSKFTLLLTNVSLKQNMKVSNENLLGLKTRKPLLTTPSHGGKSLNGFGELGVGELPPVIVGDADLSASCVLGVSGRVISHLGKGGVPPPSNQTCEFGGSNNASSSDNKSHSEKTDSESEDSASSSNRPHRALVRTQKQWTSGPDGKVERKVIKMTKSSTKGSSRGAKNATLMAQQFAMLAAQVGGAKDAIHQKEKEMKLDADDLVHVIDTTIAQQAGVRDISKFNFEFYLGPTPVAKFSKKFLFLCLSALFSLIIIGYMTQMLVFFQAATIVACICAIVWRYSIPVETRVLTKVTAASKCYGDDVNDVRPASWVAVTPKCYDNAALLDVDITYIIHGKAGLDGIIPAKKVHRRTISLPFFWQVVSICQNVRMSGLTAMDRVISTSKAITGINLNLTQVEIQQSSQFVAKLYLDYMKSRSPVDFPITQGGTPCNTDIELEKYKCQRLYSLGNNPTSSLSFRLMLILVVLFQLPWAVMWQAPLTHAVTQTTRQTSSVVYLNESRVIPQLGIFLLRMILVVSLIAGCCLMLFLLIRLNRWMWKNGYHRRIIRVLARLSCLLLILYCMNWAMLIVRSAPELNSSQNLNHTQVLSIYDLYTPGSMSSSCASVLSSMLWRRTYIDTRVLSNMYPSQNEQSTFYIGCLPGFHKTCTLQQITQLSNRILYLLPLKMSSSDFIATTRNSTLPQEPLLNSTVGLLRVSTVASQRDVAFAYLLAECPGKCVRALATDSLTSWFLNTSRISSDFENHVVLLRATMPLVMSDPIFAHFGVNNDAGSATHVLPVEWQNYLESPKTCDLRGQKMDYIPIVYDRLLGKKQA